MARRSPGSRPTVLRWFFPGVRARVARWPWLWRWIFRGVAWGTIFGMLALLALIGFYSFLASRYDLANVGRMPERTVVYDSEGREIGRLHGENRIVVKLSEVAPFFIQALLSREDNEFYEHGGIHWKGVGRALYRRVSDGAKQGASTITMQVANNSFGLGKDQSLHRKLVEMALARRVEGAFGKDQILEFYVNRIFFGTGIYGIERAAQAYFGKKARDLREDECAMLVAIIRGPNRFSPFRHYDIAVSGRNMVLQNMERFHRLSVEDRERISKMTTKVLPAPSSSRRDTWEMDAVRRALDRVLEAEDIEEGGLKVYTTLDPKLQRAAASVLERELARVEQQSGYPYTTRQQFEKRLLTDPNAKPNYIQGAVVVINNETGAVLAVVGGRDIDHDYRNRATYFLRQAGGTFKPFVYAAAAENGLMPGMQVSDDVVRQGEILSAVDPGFSPSNWDGDFTGLQRADWGLARSRDTMAVRVGEYAGVDNVRDMAERVGFGEVRTRDSSLYLGSLDTSLEMLTSAVSVFPDNGLRRRQFLIDRIEDSKGERVYTSGIIDAEVMKPGAAWLTARMMEKVCAPGGTAEEVARARLGSPVAGITGSMESDRDSWFVGFNPQVTCGVWVGFDDLEHLPGKNAGGKMALPVWIELMRHAQSLGYRGSAWAKMRVKKVDICAASGRVAGPSCRGPKLHETLPLDSIPEGNCPVHAGGRTSGGAKAVERLRGLPR